MNSYPSRYFKVIVCTKTTFNGFYYDTGFVTRFSKKLMNLEQIVVANIRRIRKERGMTQEKLAELCNTSVSYIGLLEIGRNVPKLSTIEKIADALGVDYVELFISPESQTNPSNKDYTKLKKRILADIEKDLDKYLV